MKSFSQIKKNLKNDFSTLKKVKLALLGNTSTQFLSIALRGTGYEAGLNLELFESDFNQVEQLIFDASSELYSYKPEIIIIFHSSHKLLLKYNKDTEDHALVAKKQLASIQEIYTAIKQQTSAKIIYYNFNEIDDAVYGNFANKLESSFLFQLRKLNFELMQFAVNNADFYVCDISSVQNKIGKQAFFSAPLYINTEMVIGLDALAETAKRTVDLIGALNGQFKKCIILDLDNTMWGGIIGDDGIENIQIGSLGVGKAFTELQQWIKKLAKRGVIVCICSKNTDAVARDVFEKHPDMLLRLEDIAVFMVNWNSKAENIKEIQSILQIGFDSMVFIDDNPFERNIVRENIPGITVPELPDDPADYLEYLYGLNLFETVSISEEDSQRTKQYQVEAQRVSLKTSFTDENDFLQSLNMVSLVESFNKFNTPRIAQLSQRSNQFNLRTIRYTEADIEKIGSSEDYFTLTFTLDDKFGSNGLVCVIILKKQNDNSLFIDTWFMSCRVLKRGMEHFVLNTIIEIANKNRFDKIIGEYIPTAKNALVKEHFKNLGFEQTGQYWMLEVDNYKPKKVHINLKQ